MQDVTVLCYRLFDITVVNGINNVLKNENNTSKFNIKYLKDYSCMRLIHIIKLQ